MSSANDRECERLAQVEFGSLTAMLKDLDWFLIDYFRPIAQEQTVVTPAQIDFMVKRAHQLVLGAIREAKQLEGLE